MKAVYLIRAKTPKANTILKEEGAVSVFHPDVYLANFDPSDIQRVMHGQEILFAGSDADVVPIFAPDVRNDLPQTLPEMDSLKSILQELHYEALWWSKNHGESE